MAADHHWTYVRVHPTWWINALKQTLTIYINSDKWRLTCHSQIGIQLGIRRMFLQTRLQPLLIPSSSHRHTLPFTLKIRVSPCFDGEGVYPTARGYEMLTI